MKILQKITWVLLVLGCLSIPPTFGQRCGRERWSVKTGTDAGANQIDLTNPQTATIADLIALQRPSPLPTDSRFEPTENTVFVVDATLTDFKSETDGDYHLVLQDDHGNTMVAEIPSPACVGAGSPFAARIATARSEFDTRLIAASYFQTAKVHVQVVGVGFFDYYHHQHGAAPNNIELHPVLDIRFDAENPGSPTTVNVHPVQQAEMNQQASAALTRPIRVDVLAMKQGQRVGDDVPVKVLLIDGRGQLTGATEETTIDLRLTMPSGNISSQTVRLAPGERSKDVLVHIDESGLSKLSVRQSGDRLLGSTTYVLVAPAAAAPKKGESKKTPTNDSSMILNGQGAILTSASRPRLVFASWFVSDEDKGSAATPGDVNGSLMLRVSGENDGEGVRADGLAAARIQIFYIGANPPSSDIKIWMTWDHGEISPHPLTIKRDDTIAEAQWTSRFPIQEAKVTIVDTKPLLKIEGSRAAAVRFVEPILGIDFINPPPVISIVDRANLTVGFFDPTGTPIKTVIKRPFRFASNNPGLHLEPEHDVVSPDSSDFSTIISPTSLGIFTVEASTPGYRAVQHKIRVTGWLVALLCLLGGIAGGVLAFANSQGKLWARIFTGVVVGFIATFAYVYVGLPKVSSVIVHNQVSVFFVAALAAFAGVKALVPIGKGLNLEF